MEQGLHRMGDLLEFPTPSAQGMAFLEARLRDILSAKGADEELIAFATHQLTSIYHRISETEQYRLEVRLPEGLAADDREALRKEINTGLETVRKENHSLMLELVAELVLAQVHLFQCQRSD